MGDSTFMDFPSFLEYYNKSYPYAKDYYLREYLYYQNLEYISIRNQEERESKQTLQYAELYNVLHAEDGS